jgi:hypothetical protein
MKILSITFLLLIFGLPILASTKSDSLITTLKNELTKQKIYEGQKRERIEKLKSQLSATPKSDLDNQYTICSKLFEEYKSFQFDSAYIYIQKLLNISQLTKNATRQNETRIKLAFILVSSGMFKESFDCLSHINTHSLADSSRFEYYSLQARAYSDLADYNNNNKYYAPNDNATSIKYIDSAIALCKPNSFEMLMHEGDRQIRTGQMQVPSPYYLTLLNHYNLTDHQRARVATVLSFFYMGPEHAEDRINLLALGAINDIRSSTKETLAIFKLSEELYHQGDVKDAYLFMQQAMNDAQYYGARLRQIKIGAVLPIVAAQEIIVAQNQKDRFLVYLLSIAFVAILITLITFIIFNRLKILRAKEKIIEETNVQLAKTNIKLIEDAHIKEEYIGYFFNVISGYILKLEKIKRNVERKVSTKNYDDLLITTNDINIKKERETLFNTFDRIFLKIFPNFIPAFNALLKKEDQIWPKDNEVLNTDLRIFALMRLGIDDNETVANILEYSVNTIYVYKMRIKAKAIIPGDHFDLSIMAIEAVDITNKA